MLVWILVLAVASTVVVGGVMGWSYVSREHAEARNVPLDAVDFGALRDGVYVGEYAGGMYKWRAGTVRVVVDSGKVTDIRLLNSSDPGQAQPHQETGATCSVRSRFRLPKPDDDRTACSGHHGEHLEGYYGNAGSVLFADR